MIREVDINKILSAGDVFLLASDQLQFERKKLEQLLPDARQMINELSKINNCIQQPLEEAAGDAIKIYREILADGALVIAKEADVLIEESRRLNNGTRHIKESADRIRVFSVLSVGLMTTGLGLVAGIVGLIYGAREGYPIGYNMGLADGSKLREYQIENNFLARIGLEKTEFKHDSSVMKLKPGYQLIGRQLESGYFIRVYK